MTYKSTAPGHKLQEVSLDDILLQELQDIRTNFCTISAEVSQQLSLIIVNHCKPGKSGKSGKSDKSAAAV